MIKPTIDELTQGKINRYELAVAVAKCARIITAEYSKQREAAEKAINRETDKTIYSMVDSELCDEKSVQLAVNKIYNKEFEIIKAEEAPEEKHKEKEHCECGHCAACEADAEDKPADRTEENSESEKAEEENKAE